LVYAAVIVATLLFVYAGILYVTSGPNPSNLTKAHSMFWNVLIGLIFILGAWLMVDLVMKMFYSESTQFGPWNEILCSNSTTQCTPVQGSGVLQPPPTTPGPGPGGQQPSGQTLGVTLGDPNAGDSLALGHNETLSQLGAVIGAQNCANICVTSTAGPNGVQDGCSGTGCTSLAGMREPIVGFVSNLAASCNAQNNACAVVITGGTEGSAGHSDGQFSHANGYKVDIDDANGAFNQYLQTNLFNNPNTDVDTVPGVGTRYSIQQPNGDLVRIIQESSHYDVQIIPGQFQPSLSNQTSGSGNDSSNDSPGDVNDDAPPPPVPPPSMGDDTDQDDIFGGGMGA